MGKNSGSRKRDVSDEDSEFSDRTIEISDSEPPEKRPRTLRSSEKRPSETGGTFKSRPRSPLGLFDRRPSEAPQRGYYGGLFGRRSDEPPESQRESFGLFGRPYQEDISPAPRLREQSPIRMGYLSGRDRGSNRYSIASKDIIYGKDEGFRRFIEAMVEKKVEKQLAMILSDEK